MSLVPVWNDNSLFTNLLCHEIFSHVYKDVCTVCNTQYSEVCVFNRGNCYFKFAVGGKEDLVDNMYSSCNFIWNTSVGFSIKPWSEPWQQFFAIDFLSIFNSWMSVSALFGELKVGKNWIDISIGQNGYMPW